MTHSRDIITILQQHSLPPPIHRRAGSFWEPARFFYDFLRRMLCHRFFHGRSASFSLGGAGGVGRSWPVDEFRDCPPEEWRGWPDEE